VDSGFVSGFSIYNGEMSPDASDLLKRALDLPVSERAELAGSLIESLDDATDESVQAAWEAEILGRMEDLDSGRVKPVSIEEARRRLSSAIE
jgi:putative addiction module component (TIGR02574 family)